MARILVVDDTRDTCTLLTRLFAKCGHATACLYDGSGVADALAAERFDMVLLDVMMPHVDGFDALRSVRGHADPTVSRTPVVMYSAIADPRQQERALSMGADEWVVKGTPFALLQRRIERFLCGA